MSPAVTTPEGNVSTHTEADDRDTIAAREFAALAREATPRNVRIVELCQELDGLLELWTRDYSRAERINAERHGSPRYRNACMPSINRASDLRGHISRIAANGLELPLPSDLSPHIYEGKAKP